MLFKNGEKERRGGLIETDKTQWKIREKRDLQPEIQ